MTISFNLSKLYDSIDTQRTAKQMTWSALAKAVGVSSSTIRRYRQAHDAEADGVLALVRWVGKTPEYFITTSENRGGITSAHYAPLPTSSSCLIRVDMKQVAAVAKPGVVRQGQTRTTIQNLVRIALESGCSVASLTRLSEI